MEWNKAKNYTIVFLVVINILFLGLNIINSRKNILRQEQIDDISLVLKDNNIILSGELPEKFRPMSQLSMSIYDYDYIKLQKIFFGDINNIRRTEEFSRIIFTEGNNRLSIDGNDIEFTGMIDDIPADGESAVGLANKYIKKINGLFGDYSLDGILDTDNAYQIEYLQRYGEYQVFSNNMTIVISAQGNLNIKLKYYQPVEYKGSKSSVISADEALFVILGKIKEEYPDERINIKSVELGYYLSENSESVGGMLTAIPHYRISIEDKGKYYYVNGYSGAVSH